MRKPIDDVLGRLKGVRQSGNGWVALCPGHDDTDPSLTVDLGDTGEVLLHCFAGCDTENVVAALGLSMADLFPDNGHAAGSGAKRKPKPPTKSGGRTFATKDEAIKAVERMTGGKLVAEYVYGDCYSVLRLDTPTGKTFRPLHRAPDGWKIGDPPGKLPL